MVIHVTNSVQNQKPEGKIQTGAGVMEEWASFADQSHPPGALYRNRENGKSVYNLVINNGLTININPA